MNSSIKYSFKAKVWTHNSPGGWYFVSLPMDISEEIRGLLKSQEQGWGRSPSLEVSLIKTKGKAEDAVTWKTSIWFDTKRACYILPLKAEIRKKAGLGIDDMVDLNILV